MRLELKGIISVPPRSRNWPTCCEIMLANGQHFPLTVPANLQNQVRDSWGDTVVVQATIQGKHCVMEEMRVVAA